MSDRIELEAIVVPGHGIGVEDIAVHVVLNHLAVQAVGAVRQVAIAVPNEDMIVKDNERSRARSDRTARLRRRSAHTGKPLRVALGWELQLPGKTGTPRCMLRTEPAFSLSSLLPLTCSGQGKVGE
jgi:hypothetical protein